MYLCAKRYPQAIEELERVTAENSSFSLALWFLAAAYEGAGDNERAFNSELQALQAEGESELANRLRSARSAKGMTAANQLWLEEILKTNQTGSALYIASLYAALKDREHTLAWLEKANRDKELMLWQIKYLARYDFVRGDRRFQDILKRLDFKAS